MGQPHRPQDTEGQGSGFRGWGRIMGGWSPAGMSTVATWWQLGKQCESCGAGGSQSGLRLNRLRRKTGLTCATRRMKGSVCRLGDLGRPALTMQGSERKQGRERKEEEGRRELARTH